MTGKKITHDFLVEKAAKWLTHNCPVVVTELATQNREHPDVLGFNTDGNTILIEIKADRSDFLNDAKKIFRREPDTGMGKWRYYACPKGLIQVDELPPKWGLLEWRRNGFIHTKRAQPQERKINPEMTILISCLRRLGIACTDGVSIKVYIHQTQCRSTLLINSDIDRE